MSDATKHPKPVLAARSVPGVLTSMRAHLQEAIKTSPEPEDEAAQLEVLKSPTLWWVAPEMCHLMNSAAATLPHETTHEREYLPARYGVAVLAGDYLRIPVERGDARIDAIVWADVDDGGLAWFWQMTRRAGWVSAFWEKWTYGAPIGSTVAATDNEIDRYAALIMARNTFSLFFLSQQKNIASDTELHRTRAEIRRAKRPLDPVRLIDVRRAHGQSTGNHHDVEWSHRWLVRGHWRQQPVGPGRTQRRPTWVPSHVKGPEDKPLIVRDTVHVLRGNGT